MLIKHHSNENMMKKNCHFVTKQNTCLLGLPACTHSDAQHHKRKIFTKFQICDKSVENHRDCSYVSIMCVIFLALSLLYLNFINVNLTRLEFISWSMRDKTSSPENRVPVLLVTASLHCIHPCEIYKLTVSYILLFYH